MRRAHVHDALRDLLKPYAREAFADDDAADALLSALAQALGFCVAMIARGDAAQIDRLLTAAEHRAAAAAAQTAKDAQGPAPKPADERRDG